MADTSYFRLQFIVFALVSASFTNIYITQPILPVLQHEFASVFNYLPFRMTAPPFSFSTGLTTLLYLVYIVGIFMGPTAGRTSNRFGSGNTLLGGTAVLGVSLMLILLPSITVVVLALLGICAGLFTIHATAVGTLNRKLSSGQGRANALYVSFLFSHFS